MVGLLALMTVVEVEIAGLNLRLGIVVVGLLYAFNGLVYVS